MRVARKNRQRMFYSLYKSTETQYQRDDDGNIVYVEVDGEQVPVELGTVSATYDAPIEFFASISSELNELHMRAYGVDQSAIYSKLVVPKELLPTEKMVGAIIWRTSEIAFEDEEHKVPRQSSADYTVVGRMDEVLHEDWFLLQRNSSDSVNDVEGL